MAVQIYDWCPSFSIHPLWQFHFGQATQELELEIELMIDMIPNFHPKKRDLFV